MTRDDSSPAVGGLVQTVEPCLPERRAPAGSPWPGSRVAPRPGMPWAGLFLWLASASAGAVGLGGIELTSAPGQPLEAEIPIDLITAQQLWRLQVGVAPEQTFARNGLDRAAGLDDLRFEIVRDSEGRSVVRVTSREALTMPVTLLVEATWLRSPSWPPGRLVRRYTLASADGVESPWMGAGALDTYGPVQVGDTLWSLAERLRPAGVHPHQMMVAIFEANPRGFGGNMNGMYQGATLRIPEAAHAFRLTVEEAALEAVRQLEAWPLDAERRARPGAAAPPAGVAAADAPPPEAVALQAELDEARRLVESRDEQLQALQTELMEARAATQAAEEAAAASAAAPPPPASPAGLPALNIAVLASAGVLVLSAVAAGLIRRQRRRRSAIEDRPGQEEPAVTAADGSEPPDSAAASSAADSRATMAIGSQLDLARSYVDMGDVESAQKTLRRVIAAGDADQRAQAAALLGSIGARSADEASGAGDDEA